MLLTGYKESKLLKPGSTYGLGRKGQPLLINSKKISHHHCELIIGESEVDDVVRPTLYLQEFTLKPYPSLIRIQSRVFSW